ncbi:MAG: L-seryl-tRNA(Sec) selenium transferase [Acidobacteriota bacterium]|nr:L-seryl-tRNA(Sec) selenium transferase [Acidobacteriota bacterium]
MPDFRLIPAIETLRQRKGVRALEAAFGADATVQALRAGAGRLRDVIAAGSGPGDSAAAGALIEHEAREALTSRARGSLRPVINATGVVIHTNLGRAPLAPAALQRAAAIATGYSNLEYDLAAGTRGSRTVHAESLLTTLTGADAALVVNNNAAATLLILTGLANGREVVISRGELVEIGGGFRVPDVMRQSGATLREVGTTNRTRVNDYTATVTPATAMFLRVHPSNFRIEGFTERPALADLVQAGRAVGVPVAEDIGSGCLVDDLAGEPSVQASIAAGVSLVCFSGDKLLGGPQCGIIAGRKELVDQLRTHPLMRALRADKITFAILEATLAEYVAGRAAETIPVQQMLHASAEAIETRAQALAERLAASGWRVALVSGSSAVGGGSAPGLELPTVLLSIGRAGQSAAATEAWLRTLDPPVVARIENDRVVMDLRTVPPDLDEGLASLLSKGLATEDAEPLLGNA